MLVAGSVSNEVEVCRWFYHRSNQHCDYVRDHQNVGHSLMKTDCIARSSDHISSHLMPGEPTHYLVLRCKCVCFQVHITIVATYLNFARYQAAGGTTRLLNPERRESTLRPLYICKHTYLDHCDHQRVSKKSVDDPCVLRVSPGSVK